MPVWAIILYAVTGLLLLAGVALIIFSAIDSATLLPYKRQNISEYFSDETHYYTVAGTVEELSVGTLADGAYPLTLTLDGVGSDEEGINERGRVTFTVPAETYSALAERGFFDALHGTKQNIADYGETAGRMHLENLENHHDQPGNPDKAGEVLVKLINSGQCPQRFALGSDSAREIRREYENRLAELAKWEALSRESDFD